MSTINELISSLVEIGSSLSIDELYAICCTQIVYESPFIEEEREEEEDVCYEHTVVTCFPWQDDGSCLSHLFSRLTPQSRSRILESCGMPTHIPDPWTPIWRWEETDPVGRVHGYSYRPEPVFYGSGLLFIGVELEVLAGKETARKLDSMALGRSYLKSDSSIRGEGFEVVTHPMSLDEQLAYWQAVVHHVGAELSHNSSCGMHVHISRKPLSQLQIGKVLVFLNNPTNDSWIDLVAGRSSNSYCERKKKSIEDVGNQSSRYEALNLLNNETIEFRLFASSNKLEAICSRIEFCHALVIWAKEAALDQLEWSFFMKWLYESTEDLYPYLKEELSCWRAGGAPVKPLTREVSTNPNVVDYGGWNGDYDADYCPVTGLSWDEIREESDIDDIPW